MVNNLAVPCISLKGKCCSEKNFAQQQTSNDIDKTPNCYSKRSCRRMIPQFMISMSFSALPIIFSEEVAPNMAANNHELITSVTAF